MLKEPLEYKDQVQRLLDHNMSVDDELYAASVLSQNNYYRFTGYALQFRTSPTSSDYFDGTSFKNVLNIYKFDAELRHVLRRYLEQIEVYFRTVIAHEFSMKKCLKEPHNQHYDENNYYNKRGFNEILDNFNREKGYYKDSLIMKHHNKKYSGMMPLWVMVEMMSMSDVSKLYSCMYISEQTRIANVAGCGTNSLKNHLHCMSVLRNKCAHAARLYNTSFYPSADFSKAFLRKYQEVKNDTLFAYIILMVKRLPEQEEKKKLIIDIKDVIDKYKGSIQLSLMGFPANWEIVLDNQIV